MGALTTHILDTAQGIPAAGVKIELWFNDGKERKLLKTAVTNQDGRLDAPAIVGDAFIKCKYELRFFIGDYFGDKNEPAFLDIIPICFGVSNSDGHYHVPLLVSPYSFSTYKGS